jgi:hypothetical protein
MAMAGFAGRVKIEHPFLCEQGSEGAVPLLVDPGGDGVVVGVFEGAAGDVFPAKGLDAEQAGHDGVATEDGVSDGGEDFGFEGTLGLE